MRSFIVMAMFAASLAHASWLNYEEVREFEIEAAGVSDFFIDAGAGSMKVNGDADVDAFGGMALLSRVGEVEEITDAVIYLASASFTTGIIMPVDGGYLAGQP